MSRLIPDFGEPQKKPTRHCLSCKNLPPAHRIRFLRLLSRSGGGGVMKKGPDADLPHTAVRLAESDYNRRSTRAPASTWNDPGLWYH